MIDKFKKATLIQYFNNRNINIIDIVVRDDKFFKKFYLFLKVETQLGFIYPMSSFKNSNINIDIVKNKVEDTLNNLEHIELYNIMTFIRSQISNKIYFDFQKNVIISDDNFIKLVNDSYSNFSTPVDFIADLENMDLSCFDYKY